MALGRGDCCNHCTINWFTGFKFKNKSNSSEASEGHGHAEEEGEGHHEEGEKPLLLTAQQMQEQNLKIEQAELGEVPQLQTYPAKLVVNTDRQAHVSPSFSGRVEAVYVELGQQVKKGRLSQAYWFQIWSINKQICKLHSLILI